MGRVMFRRVKSKVLFAATCVLLQVDPATPHVRAEPMRTLTATTRDAANPPAAAADRLALVRQQYQRIVSEGGWPTLPEGPKLKAGDFDPRVSILRHRLARTGDLAVSRSTSGNAFDDLVEQAVREFQKRHGLDEDGVVGKGTLAALNVSAAERLSQIELNMERVVALEAMTPRYIRINIPDFRLDVIEAGEVVMTMKVIVGKPSWKTPLFQDVIESVVFNPFWNVPASIASREILPLVRKDPDYLRDKNLKVLTDRGTQIQEVDPATVNWEQVSLAQSGYRFRQDPGPTNSLGRLQFSLASQAGIRLHDTPARELFGKTSRALSHGCVRLERPAELAQYLLRGNPAWSAAAIDEVLSEQKHQFVRLAVPVPVFVVYLTAWVDGSGILQFRPDIYRLDGSVSGRTRP